MTAVALYHKHFDPAHLAEVQGQMTRLGAPVIRCIWDENNGMWLAVEGCHRLRAAAALGISPVIKDISDQRTVSYQRDGETITRRVGALKAEMQATAHLTAILDFDLE